MTRKKKRHLGPRRKRMTRLGRLSSAKATGWVKQYGGKNIIKSYAKWFAVDPLCAVIELRMLGVDISPEREAQIKASIEARATEKQRKKKAAADAEFEDLYSDSDDTFAYIAGYTSGGLPYGVTWEELGEEPQWLYDEDEGNEESIEQCAAQRTGSGCLRQPVSFTFQGMKIYMADRFTEKQGQYLAYIYNYTVINGRPPAEADLQHFFRTTPPAIHQMVLKLEEKCLISRVPGEARSIRLLVDPDEIPRLHEW